MILRTRRDIESEEEERLAPFAVRSAASRGRVVAEDEHAYRTCFQRDRDRIVHCTAFRRLEYKTQVFVHHELDHYRNRLTHTLEGAQIARTVARTLRLNEDLAEAIVLAHDLGHTPFGHAGERVLDELMQEAGGFDHNRQSLRIVDLLEERYPAFRGLNLTYETREGLCKHGTAFDHPVPLPDATPQPSLEAQVADAADEIAYLNHDLDDGLRSGLLTLELLEAAPLWRDTWRRVDDRLHKLPERVRRAQTVKTLINDLVTDLVLASAQRIEAAGVGSVPALRQREGRLLGLSPETERAKLGLKRFLMENLYQHPQVLRATRKAESVLRDLFETYRAHPELLPARVRDRFSLDGELRAVADYVAGMTDRFALAEHRSIRDPHAAD